MPRCPSVIGAVKCALVSWPVSRYWAVTTARPTRPSPNTSRDKPSDRWRHRAKSPRGHAEFETPAQLPSAERPADVVLTTDDTHFVAECFCIYPDHGAKESMAYDREFGLWLYLIGLDLRLSGHYDVRVSRDETDQMLSEIELAVPGSITRWKRLGAGPLACLWI